MKIFPGNHKIEQTSNIDPNFDIPLAYINTSFTDHNVIITSTFSTETKKEVIPYEEIPSLDKCFFDKNGNEINNTNVFQRIENKYVYVPQDIISFSPQRFNYSVVGKKHMNYKMNNLYNIKVACDDPTQELTFVNTLMNVFGDAPKRNVAPANIYVNNQDISIFSLIDSAVKENDFLFIEAENANSIDTTEFLNSHTNVWLSVDSYTEYPISIDGPDMMFTLENPQVYNIAGFITNKYFTYLPPNTKEINYINIFNEDNFPILIMEHINKGFVIVSHKSFLNNIQNNVNLFYETMMYIYLNSYIETKPINEWIADDVPDYVVLNNKLVKKEKFTSNIELHKMFSLEQDEVSMVDINIDTPNIKFSGITSNYIIFRKDITGENQRYADPQKPKGSISVFTPRQNIIYYKDFIYKIEDSIRDKISWSINSDVINISIKPIKITSYGINIKDITTIKIPLSKNDIYYIVCKNNILNSINKTKYKDSDGIIIAEIQLSQAEEYSKIFDMRQRGGGLPEGKEHNYDLLDIGNINGRQYRKAGTLIITLPKRLEPHEDLIMNTIKKHICGEEFPIIIFE